MLQRHKMLLFCHRVAFSFSLQACVCDPEKIPVTASVNVLSVCEVSEREKRDNYIIL